MAKEIFAAFTMADMQKLDTAEFRRGRDKKKRKKKGLGLASKLALGLAAPGAIVGTGALLAMQLRKKGVQAGMGGFGSKRVTAAKSAMKQPYGPADTRTGPFDTRTGPFDTRTGPFDTRTGPFDTRPAPIPMASTSGNQGSSRLKKMQGGNLYYSPKKK